ncbi:hypothetical protein TZ03_25170 [Pseudomonas sp. 10-1B]|nr:hypothetical protein TZ03_25170 [Pseudomonas sp. 10-1B]
MRFYNYIIFILRAFTFLLIRHPTKQLKFFCNIATNQINILRNSDQCSRLQLCQVKFISIKLKNHIRNRIKIDPQL